MLKKSGLFLMVLFVLTGGFETISAQFTIKIPKIKKPSVEQPKTDEPKTNDDNSTTSDGNRSKSNKSKGDVGFMPRPRGTNVPVLLKDSVNIKISTQNNYWKTPNEQNHSSWMPLIQFGLFYDESETMRYTIEWLKPDGTVWFSEPTDDRQTRFSSEIFDAKSTDAAGTYGFRLFNSKTKETLLQGKFKVGKIMLNPGEPRYKNQAMFYVDNDWSLPVGYVGFEASTSWDYDPNPTVYMWFKGDLKADDFEARLFHNNQQVTSTDDGGTITDGSTFAEKRNPDSCFQSTEVCRYTLWNFTWKKFLVESYNWDATAASSYVRQQPDGIYTKDKPGEYTVKIFHKGQQVRETKFTVQPNGWLAANPFASQIPLDRYKTVVPVKIMGTLDKWNAAAWKTDAFYGNPLSGFTMP